jgi:hypothetical protein
MLAASAVMLSPFNNYSAFGSALHSGDGRVQAWVLAWVGHALTTGRALFDANMFFPARQALAHTDHMAALGAVGAPIWWASGNAILEFNVMQLLGPALSAFAMFVLAHAWTRDTTASVVAGLGYGFATFTLLHNAHLNLTWNAGLPLSVLAFERWWSSPTWPNVARWWIPVMFTALVSWYLALLAVVLLGVLLFAKLAERDRGDYATRGVQLGASTLLAVALMLPLAAPYLGRGSESGEAAALAADWRSYLVPSEHTIIGRWLVANDVAAPQGIWGERTLFLGWGIASFAVLGIVAALKSRATHRRTRVVFLVAVAALAASLSFGPSAAGLAPFDLLARLPGVAGFRATARFGLLVVFACALLAAFGVAWIQHRRPRMRPFVAALCGMLALGEVFIVDFPAGEPQPEQMPEIYRLARVDNARAAVALPMYAGEPQWFLEGDYLLYSTRAGFLPLANGIGRWVPGEYLAMGEAIRTFPSPETAEALRFYGITHVLFHGARYGKDAAVLLERVRQGVDFSVVATRGSDTLLRINFGPGS